MHLDFGLGTTAITLTNGDRSREIAGGYEGMEHYDLFRAELLTPAIQNLLKLP